jgi:hypothetical protein
VPYCIGPGGTPSPRGGRLWFWLKSSSASSATLIRLLYDYGHRVSWRQLSWDAKIYSKTPVLASSRVSHPEPNGISGQRYGRTAQRGVIGQYFPILPGKDLRAMTHEARLEALRAANLTPILTLSGVLSLGQACWTDSDRRYASMRREVTVQPHCLQGSC